MKVRFRSNGNPWIADPMLERSRSSLNSASRFFALMVAFILARGVRGTEWTWDLALTKYASVWQIAVQSDGKLIIAGDFDFVGRTRRAAIARLNGDGSLDSSYKPAIPGFFGGISALGDDLLVYTQFADSAALYRYGADGSRDTNFVSKVNAVSFAPVANWPYSFPATLLPSGKILLMGNAAVFPSQTGLLRLNPDGSLDQSFRSPDFSPGGTFSIESDGSILIIPGYGLEASLYRLDGSTGAILKSFGGNFLNAVFALPSGKFLLFSEFQDGRKVKRYNHDGTVDDLYTFSPSEYRWRPPLQLRDGSFLWLGSPTMLLNSEGDLSLTMPDAADYSSGPVVETPDGKFVYSAYPPAAPEPRLTTHGLKRRDRDGFLDPSFAIPGGVLRRLPDQFANEQFNLHYGLSNSLYILAPFDCLNGTNTGRFTRLDRDRSINWKFINTVRTNLTTLPNYFAVEYTAEQTLLVDSRFRLSAEGDLIASFPPLSDFYTSIESLPLLNGASIHTFRGNGFYFISSAYRFPDGAYGNLRLSQVDATLTDPNAFVKAAIPFSADGRFLISGQFTSVNDVSARDVALITAEGNVDPSFSASGLFLPPDYFFQEGGEFIGVIGAPSSSFRALFRFDRQGHITFQKEFPPSITSIYNALMNSHGELIVLSRDPANPSARLMISVLNLDGMLLRQLRIPHDYSSYQPPVAAVSPDDDLLVSGSYFGDDAIAWSGVVRIPAAELFPLRLDSTALDSSALTIRARAGTLVTVYSSIDLSNWVKGKSVTIPAEGIASMTIDHSLGQTFFQARLE